MATVNIPINPESVWGILRAIPARDICPTTGRDDPAPGFEGAVLSVARGGGQAAAQIYLHAPSYGACIELHTPTRGIDFIAIPVSAVDVGRSFGDDYDVAVHADPDAPPVAYIIANGGASAALSVMTLPRGAALDEWTRAVVDGGPSDSMFLVVRVRGYDVGD